MDPNSIVQVREADLVSSDLLYCDKVYKDTARKVRECHIPDIGTLEEIYPEHARLDLLLKLEEKTIAHLNNVLDHVL